MAELVQWLSGELEERGWSFRELARRSGLSVGSVSLVMSGRQDPGAAFCRGVAEALNEAPEKVFRLAGLLPRLPAGDEMTEELLHYFGQMDRATKEHFLLVARVFAERRGVGEDRGNR